LLSQTEHGIHSVFIANQLNKAAGNPFCGIKNAK